MISQMSGGFRQRALEDTKEKRFNNNEWLDKLACDEGISLKQGLDTFERHTARPFMTPSCLRCLSTDKPPTRMAYSSLSSCVASSYLTDVPWRTTCTRKQAQKRQREWTSVSQHVARGFGTSTRSFCLFLETTRRKGSTGNLPSKGMSPRIYQIYPFWLAARRKASATEGWCDTMFVTTLRKYCQPNGEGMWQRKLGH